MNNRLIITPKTKVGELLDSYPELEAHLIEIAPAFKKLKNPILRRTIAKITSLEQAAAVAEISVDKIVNKLRKHAGQDELELENAKNNISNEKPNWLDENRIVKRHDARNEIASGGHPLGTVMSNLPALNNGDIYLLVTPFYPAPLIDVVKEKNFRTWTEKESEEVFNNYFCKV